MADETSIYTEEEEQLLAYTKGRRKDIVENAFKNGVPEGSEKIAAVAGVLNDLDKQIETKKKLELQHKRNEQSGDSAQLVADLIKAIGRSRNPNTDGYATPLKELSNEHIPDDMVPGENELDIQPLNPDDFIENDK